MSRGHLFVISAPAGTGKTTLADMLTLKYANMVRSISYTTRKPRGSEKNGVDYFFVDKGEFEEKIKSGDFLEYAKIYDDYYGTSKSFVENILKQSKDVLLVIDVQGGKHLKNLDAVLIFIIPPSIEEIKKRLVKRGLEAEIVINKRLAIAEKELKEAQFYDYRVINDDLNEAFEKLCAIIEEKRRINAG